MKIGIILGSESDFKVIQTAIDLLKDFGVSFELEVSSAHRTPERTEKFVKTFEESGTEVFIAVAGKAAHLAGVVASHTLRPVIGVPVEGSNLGGLDALLSTVQMPKGIAVACMGLGSSGALNAALLAIQILSLKDGSLLTKLKEFRAKMASQVEEGSKRIKGNI